MGEVGSNRARLNASTDMIVDMKKGKRHMNQRNSLLDEVQSRESEETESQEGGHHRYDKPTIRSKFASQPRLQGNSADYSSTFLKQKSSAE